MGIGALWDSLVDCIVRPPRDEYVYPDELIGGRRGLFRVGRYPGVREDCALVSKRGLRLQCSHFVPKHVRGRDGRLPCVIYCHCNSGSRRDAEEAICVLIPHGVSVFTLDFAGSGLSEGQWVTLGAEEVDDVQVAVEHLRASGKVSTLGLWGRSMGAVTALLYSQRDPSIAGMVLDSPFARLTDLMLEIVQEQRLPIPRPLARLALAAMKRSVQKRAGFDITKVSPLDAVPQSFIPALFGHATGDTFIRISHAEALHAAYAGDKNLIKFDGDHNSRRPQFFYNSVSIFWHNTLQLEHLLEPADLPPLNTQTAAPAASSAPPRVLRAPGAARPLAPSPAPPLPGPAGSPAAPAPGAQGGGAGGGVMARTASASLVDADGRGLPSGAASAPVSGTGSRTGLAAGAGPGGGGGGGEGSVRGKAVAGGGAEAEEEGADVALGGAARSAPWEPRLWELDKAALERQRFRRMAGGLPSPPDPSSRSGGGYRNSAELAQVFAAAPSDVALAARLLGQDSAADGADGGGGTAGGAAGGRAGSGAAATGTLGISQQALLQSMGLATHHASDPQLPAGAAAAAAAGSRADGGARGGGGALADAGYIDELYGIPLSEEEEEAQLAAVLELSLMEAAAAAASGGGGGGAADGDGTAEVADRLLQSPLQSPRASVKALLPSGRASGANSGAGFGAGFGGSGGGGRGSTPATPAAAVAAAAARHNAGPLSADEALSSSRSRMQGSGLSPPGLPPMPAGSLSSPAHPHPDRQESEGLQALSSRGPARSQAPIPTSDATASAGPPGAAAGSAAGGGGGRSNTSQAVGAYGNGSGGAASPTAGVSSRTANPYEMYTEDELLSLAVQLSLQESAASAQAGDGGGGTGRA
ncbi:hypothetical protein HYH03_005137 [Edaphochlamys debaryana]|uniref:Serine aminopeptidase S33 domain-containing protein n=1 Tax=Edaphochlamys debaryana TaxID=47281 RepID=A0A835Y7U7_9CHLO|nr:hypothetical protein HYH03_005137 [Edaphochlamys debaryana]|eukprot:KAG2496724.1 hypothetical protein HYH03_005137 [Edaphochlamys debaryana]